MPMTWHVTGQVQRMVMGPSGQFVPSIEVHFALDNGTVASVTVPSNVYSAEEVKKRIDSKVEHLSAVADLSG